ncbi:MAG TPA: anti-sigma regulatory factor [Silvibacterium sp.]|nr:anti-sigma regulatory factor [Silvibacterium sp.]
MEKEIHVSINSDQDIVTARQKGRSLAIALGFSSGDATLIATAISELARNIVTYARFGEVRLTVIDNSARPGIQLIAHDTGPGIPDIPQALRDGFSTSGSLGLGLPGVKRLVDEFEIVSEVNRGTTVTAKKWKP